MLTMLKNEYQKQINVCLRHTYVLPTLQIATLLVMELYIDNKQTLCIFIDTLVVASIV